MGRDGRTDAHDHDDLAYGGPEGSEELVNPHATPTAIAEAHRLLARARGAPVAIQRAVMATYGPLLRRPDHAAWVARLSGLWRTARRQETGVTHDER